jgi:putative heme iron utilization protein
MWSSLPSLNPCFANLSHLEAFILKNTFRYSDRYNHYYKDYNHCYGRCLQSIPELPPSLQFLILNQQNITYIDNLDALSEIEMVSLWGNPVCGIWNSMGEWRNLTGMAKYCTIIASE